MPRLIQIAFVSVLAAACGAHLAQTSDGSAGAVDQGSRTRTQPETCLAQVQTWAGDNASVVDAGLAVTGVALFAVHGKGSAPPDGYAKGTLVGVVGGKIVEGRALVRAAIDAKAEAGTLAQIVVWAAQYKGDLLDAPQHDEDRRAQVAPPMIAGGALVFWVRTRGNHPLRKLGTLDLTSGGLVFTLGAGTK